MRPGRQLPRVHGRRSRASACSPPSCCRKPAPGMEVTTDSARARRTRRRWCWSCCSPTCPKSAIRSTPSSTTGPRRSRSASRVSRRATSRRPISRITRIAVNLDSCIQCTRCRARLPRRAGERRDRLRVPRRALEDRVRSRRSDGRLHLRRVRRMRAGVPDGRADAGARRGHDQARQAGALGVPVLRRRLPAHLQRSRTTRSSTSTAATARRITSRLCVKGRYGFDYVHHKQRLTKPLIRKPGVPKHADFTMDPANPLEYFREASWEEALDLAAGKLKAIRDSAGKIRRRRSPVSARPRAPTKRRTCSRSSCAPVSAPTTSITARGCATHRASRR